FPPTAQGAQNKTPPARGGPMGFVRRPPGEVRPAPQQRGDLRHFLSPSRRYVLLVCPRPCEFNVHAGSRSAGRQGSASAAESPRSDAGATVGMHCITSLRKPLDIRSV